MAFILLIINGKIKIILFTQKQNKRLNHNGQIQINKPII